MKKRNTVIINLWGGPGSGKSTLAASVFAELKRRGYNAELVTEFVKDWAWEGRKIDKFDQITIVAEQIRREARLFGKVDFIVTDSPAQIAAFYEMHLHKKSLTYTLSRAFEREKLLLGVESFDLILPKPRHYKRQGRYQTKAEALKIHNDLISYVDLNRALRHSRPIQLQTRTANEVLKQISPLPKKRKRK